MTTLEALAERACQGEKASLSALVRELKDPVFHLALRMLGDPRDAEDATQDILIRVITHLGQFAGRATLIAWVRAIAVHALLRVKRSRAEERAIDLETMGQLLEAGMQVAPVALPEAEARLMEREIRLSCTQGMLMTLSREERVAIVLADILELDGPAAAEAAGVSYAAFRQRLARARQRLYPFVEERCGLVNPNAPCRCDRQVGARVATGRGPEKARFAPLVDEATLVRGVAEMKLAERAAAAFVGTPSAPPTLLPRLLAALPTLIGSPE
jgi:RNA polymerase sigma factor (sigma-70 family)